MAIPVGMCSSFIFLRVDNTATTMTTMASFPCIPVVTPPTSASFPSIRLVTPPTTSSQLSTRRSFSLAATTAETAAAKPGTKEKPANREPRGIMKPRRVSPEMQDFLGGIPEIARTEVLKRIWAYIKQHNLQDPENKKIIICDDNLKKIFSNREQIGFLEIAKLIGPHFLK